MPKIYEGQRLTRRFGTGIEVKFELEEEDKPDHAATVAMWSLYCPGQSPAWSYYTLSTVHLREIEGVKQAFIQFPGATHQLFLFAMDPSIEHDPMDPYTWRRLNPVNYTGQVQVPDDDSANYLTELCVRAVLEGRLWAEPPLSGQLEPWRSCLISTSAHLRGEEH